MIPKLIMIMMMMMVMSMILKMIMMMMMMMMMMRRRGEEGDGGGDEEGEGGKDIDENKYVIDQFKFKTTCFTRARSSHLTHWLLRHAVCLNLCENHGND